MPAAKASKKRGNRLDKGGRSKTGGKFVRLGHGMVTSEAWRSLSGAAIKYYIALRDRYNGINNGHLHLSCGEAAKSLHMSKTTAMRVRRELVDKGFIRMTKAGNWYRKEATEWLLTNEVSHWGLATHDHKRWRRDETAKTVSRYSDETSTVPK